MQFESWKKILVLLVTVLGIAYAAPNAIPGDGAEGGGFLPGQKINLGLDLQGGSHLLLRVDMDVVVNERLEGMAETVRLEFRQNNLRFSGLAVRDGAVNISIRKPEDDTAARAVFAEIGPAVSISAEGLPFASLLPSRG